MNTDKREPGAGKLRASLIITVLAFAAMGIVRLLGYDDTVQGAVFLVGMAPAAWLYFTATSDTIAAERRPPKR